MKLEKYLESLKNCPDEKLSEEWGIYDNWVILLHWKFDEALNHFYESSQWKFRELVSQHYRFSYVPGTVITQVFNGLGASSLTGFGLNRNEKERQHYEFQRKNYNMIIMLHPYQEKRMEGITNPHRALVIAIDDICRLTIEKNIPLCLPHAIGTKFFNPFDYSKIIYSPDPSPLYSP